MEDGPILSMERMNFSGIDVQFAVAQGEFLKRLAPSRAYPTRSPLMEVTNQKVDFDIKTRYFRTIRDEPSGDEDSKLKRKFQFLVDVVNNSFTGLLNCGPTAFDKLTMEHDGKGWVIKLEAEVLK
jgi:hypothetical protein